MERGPQAVAAKAAPGLEPGKHLLLTRAATETEGVACQGTETEEGDVSAAAQAPLGTALPRLPPKRTVIPQGRKPALS